MDPQRHGHRGWGLYGYMAEVDWGSERVSLGGCDSRVLRIRGLFHIAYPPNEFLRWAAHQSSRIMGAERAIQRCP